MLKLALGCYYVCSLIVIIYLFAAKRQDRLLSAILLIWLPGIGALLLIFLLKHNAAEDIAKDKMSEPLLSMPDTRRNIESQTEESSLNVVSIQDALLLNDHQTRRRLLIQSLKDNTAANAQVLKQALNNDDTETSHYAAAAIMEMNRKLLNKIQVLSHTLVQQPDNLNVKQAYARTIKSYINSGFIDEDTYHRYLSIWAKALVGVLQHDVSNGDLSEYYIDKINCDLERRAYDEARYYSDLFLKNYPLHEHAYIMAMKLHFTLNNVTELIKVMQLLKQQPIHLSTSSLRLIRHWA